MNNRVLIWNSIPTTNNQPADVELGQPDFASNAGVFGGASSLNGPLGVFYDGSRLYVADASNSRVLIWNSLPTMSAEPADLVLGQPDFASSGEQAPSPSSLVYPGAIYSDGTRLFVAGEAHGRVLVWNTIPTTNNQPATGILGKDSFTSLTGSPASPYSMDAPAGLALSGMTLWVADPGFARVVGYDTIPVLSVALSYSENPSAVGTGPLTITATFSGPCVAAPPVAYAGPSALVLLPNPISRINTAFTTTDAVLDGSQSMAPAGQPLTYQWSLLDEPARSPFSAQNGLFGAATARARVHFDAGVRTPGGQLAMAGTYTFQLEVTSGGQSSVSQVSVVVLDPGSLLPSADAGVDQQVGIHVLELSRVIYVAVDGRDFGVPHAQAHATVQAAKDGSPCDLVTLDSTGSANVGAAAARLTYRWQQVAGPPVALSDPNSPVLTYVTPDLGDGAGRLYAFDLTVDNGLCRSLPSQVSVVVTGVANVTDSLSLLTGLNLVGLPIHPAGVDDAQGLVTLTGASFAARLSAPEGIERSRFEVYVPGSGAPAFALRGNESYLVMRSGAAKTLPLTGQRWNLDDVHLTLPAGFSFLHYPRGVAAGLTCDELRQGAGSPFVLRVVAGQDGRGRFQVYEPGLLTPYPLDVREGYGIGLSRGGHLYLPGPSDGCE